MMCRLKKMFQTCGLIPRDQGMLKRLCQWQSPKNLLFTI